MAFISSRVIAGLVASTCASGWLVSGCGSPGVAHQETGGSGNAIVQSGGVTGSGGTGTGNTPAGGGSSNGGTAGGGTGGVTGTGNTANTTGGSGGSTVKTFDAGTDPNRNAVAPGEVCERIATIQCAGEQFCCDNPGRTFDDCKATMKKGCQDSHLDEITGNTPLSGYNTANATPVFQHYEDLASKCDQTVTAWGGSLQGLRALVPGTVAPGGNCTPEALELQKTDVVAAHLAPCTSPDQAACLPAPVAVPPKAWKCAALADIGGACFSDVNCKDGLYCINPNLQLSGGTCAQRKIDTADCAVGNECASLLCKQGKCATIGVQTAYCLQN